MIQASVTTVDGAIASWMDESLSQYAKSLDLSCTACDAIKSERVKSLHVCNLYSAVLTEQGRVSRVAGCFLFVGQAKPLLG